MAPATRSIYKLSTLWGKVYPVKQFKLLREASVSNSQNVVEQKVLNQPIQASTMMSVSFKNNRWIKFFENAPWYCQWIQIVQKEWPYGQNSDQIWSNFRLSTVESGTVIYRVRKRDKRLGGCLREREDWQRAREWGTTPETDYHAVGFDLWCKARTNSTRQIRSEKITEHSVCSSCVVFIDWCLYRIMAYVNLVGHTFLYIKVVFSFF